MKTVRLLLWIGFILLAKSIAVAADVAPDATMPSEPTPVEASGSLDTAPIPPPPVWSEAEVDSWNRRSGYLHPFVSVAARYTDNFYDSPTTEAKEITTVVSPGLWLALPASSRQLLNVNASVAAPGGLEVSRLRSATARRFQGYALYRADIEEHYKYPEEDRVNQRAEGLLQYHAPSGFAVEAMDIYVEERDPFFTGATRNLQQETYASNLFQLFTAIPLTARIALRGDYTHYRLDFDSTANAFRDREDNGFGGTLAYRVSPRTNLLLRYEQIDIDYRYNLLSDSIEHHAYAGFEWEMTAKSRGRVLAGYGLKEFQESGREDRGEFIGEARFDHRLTPKTSLYLLVVRKENEPDSPSEEGALAHRFQIGYRQRLSAKISAAFDFSSLQEDYRTATIIDRRIGIREDTTYSAGGALSYAPWRSLVLDLGYRYLKRDSNFEMLRYDSNTLYFRVTAAL